MKGKKKGSVAILISIFLVLELVLFINVQAQQTNLENNQFIIVDENGGGDYKTIREAIYNAPDKTTIYIKAGTYSEIIDITKSINLIGEDEVIINPISEKNSYAMRVGAPGTKISKLSVTNGAPGPYTSGIYISASNTELEDCNLCDTPIGIAIWTSNNIIENCNFWQCKDEGIAFLGSSYSECNSNKITNCIFRDNCDGIELQYSSNNIIKNCEFYNNTHSGIDAIESSNSKNVISGCKIYNNQVHGIYFSSSSYNQIIDCTIANNKDGNIINTKDSIGNKITNTSYNIENKELKLDENIAGYQNNRNTPDNTINNIFNTISKIKNVVFYTFNLLF